MSYAAGPLLAYIPSPPQGVWHVGPIPIRAYALCIIVGIIVAIWWGERRFAARGGAKGTVVDIAVWAVPFGLVGGRLYHVATDWWRYFGSDDDPIGALKIWDGGLGIPGAIALGAVGLGAVLAVVVATGPRGDQKERSMLAVLNHGLRAVQPPRVAAALRSRRPAPARQACDGRRAGSSPRWIRLRAGAR